MAKRITVNGRFVGEVDDLGRYFDANGNYAGEVDEYGRFYDQNHVYKGHIDELGRSFGANGEFVGAVDENGRYFSKDGTYGGSGAEAANLARSNAHEESETVSDYTEGSASVSHSKVEYDPDSKLIFMSKGKFIKWVVILFVLCILGGTLLSKLDDFSFGGGLAIGYAVTAIAYGFSITNSSFADTLSDSSIFGAIRFALSATAGIVIFPIHLVRGIVYIIQREI